ncbi:MAG: type II toxin-antitoxin system VapC family toxin [bacterium]
MMKKPRIYLDNCCFNRPYDDQLYETIRLETEAKLYIQDSIKNGKLELTWSFMLDFENSMNPYEEQKDIIQEWKKTSFIYVAADESIRNNAKKIAGSSGIKPKDALHLSCALHAKCDYFLTTDKSFQKKVLSLKDISVLNPINFIIVWEER